MKQLELFFDKLRDAGYIVTTNWQAPLTRGHVEHVTIQGKVGMTYAVFQVYGDDGGYQMFIEAKGVTFDEDFETVKGIVD